MSRKETMKIHPLDPTIEMVQVLDWVSKNYPGVGTKTQLAQLLGTSKTMVTNWDKRPDGLLPAPWNYRFLMLKNQIEPVLSREPLHPGAVTPLTPKTEV